MPKALEAKLKKQAKKLGLGEKRTGAYVYGTLGKIEKKRHPESVLAKRKM
jgi:hypothetical protein